MVRKRNSLRIVGGVWRSRRIQFADTPQIRPTPDRVRETLFNWLAERINGAHCLDLFAGSGALGFEAASRGAAHVVQVDSSASVVSMLAEQKRSLEAWQVDIVQQDAQDYLSQAAHPFDIVFLDPPFRADLLQQVLPVLLARRLVCPSGLVYIESPAHTAVHCPDSLHRIREKTASQVRHELYEWQP